MNKIYYVVVAIIVALFCIAFAGCGSNNSSEDFDYRKACAEKNWPKAYEIVDKIKEQANEYHTKYASANGTRYDWAIEAYEKYENANTKYNEALKYVILQESMVVLEESGEGGLMRIVGIAKEHNADDWLYEELIDVAKKIGDADLEEKFNNIINSSSKNITSDDE